MEDKKTGVWSLEMRMRANDSEAGHNWTAIDFIVSHDSDAQNTVQNQLCFFKLIHLSSSLIVPWRKLNFVYEKKTIS